MATSCIGSAAQELGAGGGATTPFISPATTRTFVFFPLASVFSYTGMASLHSMAKCGSAFFAERGRLSQI